MADGAAGENGGASEQGREMEVQGFGGWGWWWWGGACFVFVEPSTRCRSLIRTAELSDGPAICLKMLDTARRTQVAN